MESVSGTHSIPKSTSHYTVVISSWASLLDLQKQYMAWLILCGLYVISYIFMFNSNPNLNTSFCISFVQTSFITISTMLAGEKMQSIATLLLLFIAILVYSLIIITVHAQHVFIDACILTYMYLNICLCFSIDSFLLCYSIFLEWFDMGNFYHKSNPSICHIAILLMKKHYTACEIDTIFVSCEIQTG